jgi:hypothetical protein
MYYYEDSEVETPPACCSMEELMARALSPRMDATLIKQVEANQKTHTVSVNGAPYEFKGGTITVEQLRGIMHSSLRQRFEFYVVDPEVETGLRKMKDGVPVRLKPNLEVRALITGTQIGDDDE